MPTHVFQVVKRYGAKAGKCAVCGKRTTRSIVIEQTVNHLNKVADGSRPKTASEVGDACYAEVVAWEAEPVKHARCE